MSFNIVNITNRNEIIIKNSKDLMKQIEYFIKYINTNYGEIDNTFNEYIINLESSIDNYKNIKR